VERGVYFDGWNPGQNCYHPSLPPRRLTMIDHLQDMRGTTLVWAGLGGGMISLPYLEEEAYGEIPARFRQYGYVNESEFVKHCSERGIDLFGIVFESQGWEFPAELVDGKIVALNELRGAGPRSELGLTEFTQDRGPANWKPFAHYFPDGLVNSAGEQVTDILDECCSRDLEGNRLHAHWVEVPNTGSTGLFMDRNNPVWREYLKAVVRIQIDAGVAGVQLDETCTPMSALRYSGCFCKDCVKGFRAFLARLPTDELPAELDDVDLSTFDYRQWLLGQGFKAQAAPQALPLYPYYRQFLTETVVNTYAEIANHAKEYAHRLGRTVRVAGNFFDLAPTYDPMVDYSDVLVTEMSLTRYQQPWWFRHGVGLARKRPLIAVENPYGGMIPELSKQLQRGRCFDRFRLTIFEASAMGANMALPYGSWMGSEIKDSYWVCKDLVDETGQFLEEIDAVTSDESYNDTAVIFSVLSTVGRTIDADQYSDDGRFFTYDGELDTPPISYWPIVESLSRNGIPFDSVIFPNIRLRPDDVTAEQLARYRTVVVPSCWAVNSAQHQVLMSYLDNGGNVVLHGPYGTDLTAEQVKAITDHPRTRVVADQEAIPSALRRQVEADLGPLAAVNLHRLPDDRMSVHVVNFDFDEAADAVVRRKNLEFVIDAPVTAAEAVVYRPGQRQQTIPVSTTQGRVSFVLPECDTYAVVELR
jgi:hypothetical protein